MKCGRLQPTRFSGASVIALIWILGSLNIAAQDWDDREARAALTIGPGFHGGASMILDSPEGFEIKPTFSWKLEAHATYPFTPVISAGLGLGYEKRGTYLHVFDRPSDGKHLRIGYFFLHPHFSFSGFSIGTLFGFPVSEPEGLLGFGSNDDVLTMIEPRIEGIIPLADLEDGWFSLIIGGGYSVTQYFDYPTDDDFFGNWNHVSAYLGMRFEFTVPGTERN